jgi:VanZ family protein
VPEARAASRGSFAKNVLPAFAYAALVFWGGTIDVPPPPFDAPGVPWDKLGHVVAFALMQLVWWRAVRYELASLGPRKQSFLAALIAALLGGVLELYQAALPHRSAELLDLLADVVGATLAALLVLRRVQSRTASLAASSSLTNE